MTVRVADIRESESALRSVQRDTEQYQGLVDSVKLHGVLKPILVREDVDADTGATFYWLIDGLQRWNAAKDAGRETIDVKVIEADEAQVLEAQIITNIHKVETTPTQYSAQLKRIMALNPTMTVPTLAQKLSRSVSWLQDRLGLLKLTKEIGELVDAGRINITNAYALASLPVEEQANYVDRAMSLQPQEFVPQANARVKEIKEAKRQGRAAGGPQFVPTAHLQKISDIKAEIDGGDIGRALVAKTGAHKPSEVFRLALQWALHLDPTSLEVAKAKFDAERAAADAKKKAREEERAQKQREKLLAGTPA
jgi:ParB/RepB/Spo0J family partition protein